MTRTPLQQQPDSTIVRTVDGRVMLGTRNGPVPVANHWVLVHRVGPDRAAPLDSTRTDAAGRFHLRYHTSGDPSAVYFSSTSFGGVAYFTSPFRGTVAKGDDALLTVFDTTSGPVAIKLGGRHLIIGAPQSDGNRPIGEVYDLQNDSTVTVVARDSVTPIWSTHLPPRATDFQLNASGELAAGAVTQTGSTVGLFAPLSPGIRQLAFTYELPMAAFPLTLPMERPVGILEVLVQEPSGHVSGLPMREVPPVRTDGRLFRRFLAEDVPANAVVTIDIPKLIGPERKKVYLGVELAFLAAMAVALLFAMRRSFPRMMLAGVRRSPTAPREPTRAETLIRSIADLDANFERESAAATDGPSPAARAAYDAKRAKLKAELARVHAAGDKDGKGGKRNTPGKRGA